MYTWKIDFTALLEDGQEVPNQTLRFTNFWRAASYVKQMLEKNKIVRGSVNYTDLRKA